MAVILIGFPGNKDVSMIYANSISLIQNAQSHTLLTHSGQRELELPGGAGQIACPECGRRTRVVLVQEFEAFHVCENTACALFVDGPGVSSLLKAIEVIPITRHGA